MTASTYYSPFNFSFSSLFATIFPNQTKKHPLLILATKIMIFVLCCHALHHNVEREVEIEEEEPELVVMLSPGVKRSSKKEHV